MIALPKTSITTSIKLQNPADAQVNTWQKFEFLQTVLESLEDGILVLNETGKLVHANAAAHRICEQLNQDDSNSNLVPLAIWQLCQSLLEHRDECGERDIILSDEIVIDKSTTFRIRVRLLDLDRFPGSCLLVTLENSYESLKNVAIAEIKKYDLTRREAEIWYLYRNQNSYKEIASQLYITINTVKKHMKNIHAKRQAALAVER